MKERMDKRTNEWTNEQTNGQTNEEIHKETMQLTNKKEEQITLIATHQWHEERVSLMKWQ